MFFKKKKKEETTINPFSEERVEGNLEENLEETTVNSFSEERVEGNLEENLEETTVNSFSEERVEENVEETEPIKVEASDLNNPVSSDTTNEEINMESNISYNEMKDDTLTGINNLESEEQIQYIEQPIIEEMQPNQNEKDYKSMSVDELIQDVDDSEYCPNCGSKVSKTDEHCNLCGTEL